MKTQKRITYVYDHLQQAVEQYHQMLYRLEKWEEKYPHYSFEIYITTTGTKRQPSVLILIHKTDEEQGRL